MNAIPYPNGNIFQLENITGQSPFSHDTIECEGKFVRETLTSEIPSWDYKIIFINAPTGSGKSSFILEDLANYATNMKDGPKRILILSNRLALNIQQKNILANQHNNFTIGSKMLKNLTRFDNVSLCTYQGILSQLPYLNPNQISHIVFDEAHFFYSDTIFNSHTGEILTALLLKFPLCCHIYMSATLKEVIPIISYAEQYVINYLATPENLIFSSPSGNFQRCKKHATEYHFKPDFSHISLFFFHSWEAIENKISLQSNTQKWLVFVNKKETGKEIVKSLKTEKISADFIDADSSDEKIRSLARRQFFPETVLVGTKVIDNGVSIKDDALTNIVVDFVDYVELIQMIGRKRLAPGEKIALYVKIPTKDEIRTNRQAAESLYGTLYSFQQNPNFFFQSRWGNLTSNEQNLFSANSMTFPNAPPLHQIIPNQLAEYQLATMCGKYEELEDQLLKEPHAYEYQVCQWLDKTYSDAMNIEGPSIKNAILKIVQEYVEHSPESAESPKILTEMKAHIPPAMCKSMGLHPGGGRALSNINVILKTLDIDFEAKKKNNHIIFVQPSVSDAGETASADD